MRFRSLSVVLLSLSTTTLLRAEAGPTAPPKTAPEPPPEPPGPSSERAKAATERAQALPEKDRSRLGKPLLELAELWNRVSVELANARELEKAADEKEQALVELDARTERARLLIEQTEARRARALARLKELEGNQTR